MRWGCLSSGPAGKCGQERLTVSRPLPAKPWPHHFTVTGGGAVMQSTAWAWNVEVFFRAGHPNEKVRLEHEGGGHLRALVGGVFPASRACTCCEHSSRGY